MKILVFYISGFKPLLQCALLRLAPTTLGEAFFIARIIEAHFETIVGKKPNIEEKIDIVLSWPSEDAPPVIKGSLDANEDIGVVEDGGDEFDGRLDEINLNLSEELADNRVSPIPTSLVAHESSRACQLWEIIGIGDAHGLMDNGRNHKFVQPNVWGWMSDSQSAYSSYHLEGKMIFEGVGSVTAWVAEGGRMVLCYVQGSGRWKRKKGVGCGSERHENYESGRRDCGRIKI
nr:hypothetical protein [Tanacetum cinerariifolium]